MGVVAMMNPPQGGGGQRRSSGGEGLPVLPWDSEAPWQPWAQQHDPIGSIELDIAWEGVAVSTSEHAKSAAGSSGGDDDDDDFEAGSEGATMTAQQRRDIGRRWLRGPLRPSDPKAYWSLHAVRKGMVGAAARR